MHKYINEIKTVTVDGECVGFIARRVTTMGGHDYGHLWSFAPHNDSGKLKFRGAYQTRREAREALAFYYNRYGAVA